jgi:hypothetical protein
MSRASELDGYMLEQAAVERSRNLHLRPAPDLRQGTGEKEAYSIRRVERASGRPGCQGEDAE